MKFLLLVLALFAVSCASNSNKKMEDKAKVMAKDEKVKAEAKVEKEVAKKKMEKASASASAKTCSLAGDKRIIEIKKMDKGCEVFYSKDGENKSIASAQNDLGHCDAVQDRIISKLSDAGFKCE